MSGRRPGADLGQQVVHLGHHRAQALLVTLGQTPDVGVSPDGQPEAVPVLYPRPTGELTAEAVMRALNVPVSCA